MKAEQVYDGVPFEIEGATVRMVCCDCGLSHDFRIVKRPRKRGYRITVHRNERSTAAIRRGMKRVEVEKQK
jgi:predicted metalloprotease